MMVPLSHGQAKTSWSASTDSLATMHLPIPGRSSTRTRWGSAFCGGVPELMPVQRVGASGASDRGLSPPSRFARGPERQ